MVDEHVRPRRLRSMQIVVAGLNRRLVDRKHSTERRTMGLWEPIVELGVTAVGLFGGTSIEVGQMKEVRATEGYPKRLRRSARISAPSVDFHAELSLEHQYVNPIEGDAWSFAVRLLGNAHQPEISGGFWCDQGSMVTVSGYDLAQDVLDALAAATADAFGGPYRRVERSGPS